MATRVFVGLGALLAATTSCLARQEQGKSGLEPVKPGDEAKVRDAGLIDLLGPATQPPDPDTVAGLRPKSHAPVLTLRRAYDLALVRHRAPSPPRKDDRLAALDPKALDALARRYSVADFARFRQDLFARRGDTLAFRDPAPDFLGLLVTLQRVESARRRVMEAERLMVYDREQLHMKTGVTQLQIDRDVIDIERQRDLLGDALRRHREALDDFKVALGLPPDAPLVVDSSALAPFTDAFDEARLWLRQPDSDLQVLGAIILRPPDVLDVTIEGRSLMKLMQRDPPVRDPGVLEEWLQSVTRSDRLGGEKRSLYLRRLARRLYELYPANDGDRVKYILAVRIVHQTIEQIFAPPPEGGGPALNAVPLVHDLVRARRDVFEMEDRMVASWAAYQSDRLALVRELGLQVGRDWESYLAEIIPPVAPRVLKAVPEKPAELPEPPPPPPPPGR
ncbi:MAG TPA: hypothetical protein VG406_11455 [Isosphaeraceae bacterium]|nr:hypothetical protein [Isosphaeraceae bacterium]